jgi:hypothetical protein
LTKLCNTSNSKFTQFCETIIILIPEQNNKISATSLFNNNAKNKAVIVGGIFIG